MHRGRGGLASLARLLDPPGALARVALTLRALSIAASFFLLTILAGRASWAELTATQRGKSNVSLDFKVLFERVTGKFPAPLKRENPDRCRDSPSSCQLLLPCSPAQQPSNIVMIPRCSPSTQSLTPRAKLCSLMCLAKVCSKLNGSAEMQDLRRLLHGDRTRTRPTVPHRRMMPAPGKSRCAAVRLGAHGARVYPRRV